MLTTQRLETRPAHHTGAFWSDHSDRQAPVRGLNELMEALGTVTHFERNCEIFAEEDRADFMYRVVSGTVRSTKLFSDGRRQIGAFHMAGDVFGLETGTTHRFAAEAVEECQILVVRRSAVTTAAARDTQLTQELWALMAGDLDRARDQMVLLGRKTAPEKLAAFLIELSGRLGGRRAIDLPMSRQDVADYLGLTIETISRLFTQFEHEGLIQLCGARHVTLKDAPGLARRSGG